jgi:hypothetical protein
MSDRLEKAFRAGEIGEREKEQAEDAREEIHILGRIAHDWHEVAQELIRFLKTFGKPAASGFTFQNTGENAMPTNFSVTPGNSFQITATPNGTMGTAVPVWTCSDPLVSFTPDVTGLILAGATSATDTAASFTLTLTGINSAGATISSTQVMSFTPAVVTGTPATAFTFVQNS